jgi:hypothetical protein
VCACVRPTYQIFALANMRLHLREQCAVLLIHTLHFVDILGHTFDFAQRLRQQ